MHVNNRTGIKSVEYVLTHSMLAPFPYDFLACNKCIQWNKSTNWCHRVSEGQEHFVS